MKIIRLYCSDSECHKSFRSEEQLAIHLQTHLQGNPLEDQNKYECPICLHKFPTKRSVSAHKRVHQHQLASNYSSPNGYLFNSKPGFSQNNVPEKTFEINIQDIILPPIIGPKPAVLPEFSSLFKLL